jgi:hypothetical protein
LYAATKSATVHHLHLLRDNFLCQCIHAPSQLGFIQFLIAIGIKLLHHLLSPSLGIEAGQAAASKTPSATRSSASSRQTSCTRCAGLVTAGVATRTFSSLFRLDILRRAFRISLWIVILSVGLGGYPAEDQHRQQDC